MRLIAIRLAVFAALLAGTVACHQPLYLQSYSGSYYTIDTSLTCDSDIVRMLQPYKIGVDTQMKVVIGHTDIPLTKAQPECTLGNFMADAQLKKAKEIDAKVVASVMNYGGIRLAYLPPGAITRGNIYELMPFDNMLTIIDVPGSIFRQFCNHMARYRGWPVSGITYSINGKEANDIKINGELLNDHLVYKVALSDYIAKGGDHCDFLLPLKKRFTNIFIRDALIEYVQALEQENKPLHPFIENRIRYAE